MIELRDVHKSFGPIEVLKGITASVEKSEVVCIIGPSGSGKSTILRCINGLESYDAGDILVEGARVDRQCVLDRRDPDSGVDGVPALQPVPAPDGASRTSSKGRST